MSGIIANRSGITDVYAHCHNIPNPNYKGFESTETNIVKLLVTGKTLSTADAQTLQDYKVVKPSTNDRNQIMPVCYPADTIEQDAVLASVYKNNTVTFDSNSTKLSKPSSNNNEVTLSVDNTSTSIYDTIVKVNTSIEPNLSSLDGTVEAIFDSSDSNAVAQYAVNSQYNTKTNIVDMQNANVYTTYMQEDTNFNTTQAFGKNYTQYVSGINSDTGEPIWSNYSNTVIPITQHFTITERTAESISNDDGLSGANTFDFDKEKDIGIFKVEISLNSNPVKTKLFVGDTLNENDLSPVTLAPFNPITNPIDADTHIKNLPLFHETNSLALNNQTKTVSSSIESDDSKFLLPNSDMSIDSLKTIVSDEYKSEIQPNFEFKVEVDTNVNSGYKFSDTSYDLATIDDSELKDSLIYMRDWVDGSHNLSLSSGELSLTTGTNGLSSFISNNRVVLSNGREKLSELEAGVDGVLQMNSHSVQSRALKTASSNDSGLDINVYYENDTIPSGLSRLDDDLCTEPNVSFGWQKVIESSSLSNIKFKDSSNTTLNLVSSNAIVNSNYTNDASKFSYSFDQSQLPSDVSNNVVQLWKITTGVNLLSQPNTFFTSDNESVDFVENNIVLYNTTPNFNQTVRELRQYLKTKTLTDLSFNSELISKGWTSELSDNNSNLVSSSNAAYASINRFPNYDEDIFNEYIKNDSDISINYTINFTTKTQASESSQLNDLCDFIYNYSDNPNVNYKTTISDFEMDVIRTESDTISISVVPTSDYTFRVNSGYSTSTHEVIMYTTTKKYICKFNIPFAQYINYKIITPNITSLTNNYAIRKKSDGAIIRTNLSRDIRTPNGTTTNFYTQSYETISPTNPSHFLTFSGVLNKNDFKELLVTTQSKNMNTNEWSNISNTVSGSVYYTYYDTDYNPVEPIVNNINDTLLPGQADIETTLIKANQISITLDKPYYYIPLVMDYASQVFSLKTFNTTSSRTDLSSKTSLVSINTDGATQLNNKFLDINNLYNTINSGSWETPTNYSIVSSIDGNDITIKVVKTTDPNNAVFTIGINDNYIYVGEFLISNIKKDVIRMRETIGSTYTETFMECEPNIPSITMKNGVYVDKANTSSVIPLGSYQLFNLKNDLLAWNLVDNTLGTASEITTLGPYQYTNSDLYSRTFSLNRYRGHGHPSTTSSTSINQYYNIVRPAINATFTITKNSNSLSQTFNNIYSGAVFNLNDLKRNVSDTNPSDIGLQITFNFSMPNSSESRSKAINVVGDDVIITITNPLGPESFADQSPGASLNPALYPLNKTLKDYDLIKFSGDNSIRYLDGPMKIRSSRIKLKSNNLNNSFTQNSMVYSIKWVQDAGETIVIVTKAKTATTAPSNFLNFVGNPESIIGAIGGPSYTRIDASTHELNLERAQNEGVNIGVHNIKLKTDVPTSNKVHYYVSVPPYYKYETMGIGNNISIPYNYSAGDFSGNRIVKYMPNINSITDVSGCVNPFTNITYKDVAYNSYNVTVDTSNNLVNNMKMKIVSNSIRKQKDLVYNANADKKFISFFGSKMIVDLYKSNGDFIKNVYNNYITSLVNDLSSNMTLVSSNINSGIKFMVRQPISVIGYSSNETDAENESFYNTSDKNKWFPFKFTLTNVNMVRSEMTFNMLAGPGSYPILYTVKNNLSYANPEVLYRRVYKYENNTAVDFDATTLRTNLTFSSRQYVDIQVPSITTGVDFNSNMFDNLLNAIEVNSLSWQNDTDFVNDIGNATFTLLYGNSTIANTFRRELFYANNGETVFTLITYKPLMVMNNQIGMPVFSILWNGFTKTPQVLTEAINLQPERSSYLVTDSTLTTDLAKHTLLKL